MPPVTVLRQGPVLSFLGIKPIAEGLSWYLKNPNVWILPVDVFMKKQCDVPVALTKGLGGAVGIVSFMKET